MSVLTPLMAVLIQLSCELSHSLGIQLLCSDPLWGQIVRRVVAIYLLNFTCAYLLLQIYLLNCALLLLVLFIAITILPKIYNINNGFNSKTNLTLFIELPRGKFYYKPCLFKCEIKKT